MILIAGEEEYGKKWRKNSTHDDRIDAAAAAVVVVYSRRALSTPHVIENR